METIAIPWAALIALGSAVAAVITALWAKIRQLERSRDEWTERWAAEVKRNQDPPEWEERTDIRHRREELLKEAQSSRDGEDRRAKREEERLQDEIEARIRAYNAGRDVESTPPKLRRGK